MIKGYEVVIRRNEDGEIRTIYLDHDFAEHTFSWWADGNMNCDCNRQLMFEQDTDDEDFEVECSNGKYSVLKFILPSGEIDGPDADKTQIV